MKQKLIEAKAIFNTYFFLNVMWKPKFLCVPYHRNAASTKKGHRNEQIQFPISFGEDPDLKDVLTLISNEHCPLWVAYDSYC